jgi:hypothetical protein
VSGQIPEPNPEPALQDAEPGRSAYASFKDDEFGGSESFERLVYFLHEHHFPRIHWSRLTLSHSKCRFFVPKIDVLGHERSPRWNPTFCGDKVAAFRQWGRCQKTRPALNDSSTRFPFRRVSSQGQPDGKDSFYVFYTTSLDKRADPTKALLVDNRLLS